MDLHKGMKLLSFASFTIGITAFVVCGWTFISNRLLEDSAEHWNVTRISWNSTHHVIHDKLYGYQLFRTVIFRSSIIVVLVSVVQIASAGVVLWSPPQGARPRAKIWLGINVGINLVLLICFILPLEYANGNIAKLNVRLPSTILKRYNIIPILHLESFYIGLTLNFVVHFLAIIFSMILLRNDVNKDYELVMLV